jgi:hypothetical protein
MEVVAQRSDMMAASRDELRDHLAAVIEAARELPKEDRAFLADSFLDELDKQYQLVPRSGPLSWSDPGPRRPRISGFPFIWVPVLLVVLFALPFVMFSSFVFVHHPVILLALMLLVLFRFGRPGMRRRGPWGSRRLQL